MQGLWQSGFGSIYEFAAKLAAISNDQVNRILQLEKRLADKPVLHSALIEGRISVNKLIRIAPIVTDNNEAVLLRKAEILSSRALEIFVKEAKIENNNGFAQPLFEIPEVHVHSLKLDADIEAELTGMQDKGIDVNQLLRNFLKERKEKIEQQKTVLAKKQERERDDRAIISIPAKRYIPVAIKNIIQAEFGNRCSVTSCQKNAENIHHEKEFANSQCHDPHYLKPLCRGHHELQHVNNMLIQKFKRQNSIPIV